MPGPRRNRWYNQRPINPLDNAGTTGLPVNPNGTLYAANPFPNTAQNGAQGQFGAMLPQVNVGAGQQFQNAFGFQPKTVKPDRPAGIAGQAIGINPYLANPVTRPATGVAGLAMAAAIPPVLKPPTGFGAQTTPMTYGTTPAATGISMSPHQTQSGYSAATMEIMNRIQQNPAEFYNLPKSSQDVLEKFITQGVGQQQPQQTTDKYGGAIRNKEGQTLVTDAQGNQYYAGPTKREALREARQRHRARRIAKGDIPTSATASPRAVAEPAGFTGSFGVVSFNTGTG